MELFCVGLIEYELIWSCLDPFQPQLHDLGKFISTMFSFLVPMGPLGSAGALWLGQARPGLALGWTLGAPKSVFEQPSITFRTFGTRYGIGGIYRNGVKNCASEPTFHTRRGPE